MRARSMSKRRPRNRPSPVRLPRGVLAAMPAEEVAGIVDRVCRSKERFPGPGPARRTARRLSATMDAPVHGYRCPFADDGPRHWHVGHMPSLAGLDRLALAIRVRAQREG
jgi:hypothetical protein